MNAPHAPSHVRPASPLPGRPSARAPRVRAALPFAPRWDAQQLADAVPARLSELFAAAAPAVAGDAAATHAPAPRRPWLHAYRDRLITAPAFRIHG